MEERELALCFHSNVNIGEAGVQAASTGSPRCMRWDFHCYNIHAISQMGPNGLNERFPKHAGDLDRGRARLESRS